MTTPVIIDAIAVAVLAALCLALGGILIAGWLAYVNIRVPSESVQGEVSIPVEAAGPPEAAFPETLPLKSRRDFDFGDWTLGGVRPRLRALFGRPAAAGG